MLWLSCLCAHNLPPGSNMIQICLASKAIPRSRLDHHPFFFRGAHVIEKEARNDKKLKSFDVKILICVMHYIHGALCILEVTKISHV